jgi:hypothetical protein
MHTAKNETTTRPATSMPSHGVKIIDGIPVHLKDDGMYAFQPGSSAATAQIKLGTYSDNKATWNSTDAFTTWLNTYRESITSRSRK